MTEPKWTAGPWRHASGPSHCPHRTRRDPTIDIVLDGADMAALALALDDDREQWDGSPQGLCDMTLTERLNLPCVCDTYEGNLGPCAHFQEGASGRCVYCDHAPACHPKPPPELANARGEMK